MWTHATPATQPTPASLSLSPTWTTATHLTTQPGTTPLSWLGTSPRTVTETALTTKTTTPTATATVTKMMTMMTRTPRVMRMQETQPDQSPATRKIKHHNKMTRQCHNQPATRGGSGRNQTENAATVRHALQVSQFETKETTRLRTLACNTRRDHTVSA
jgi:hypothetical protein